MYRFTGKDGEFIPGVPARDLTDKEAELHPEVKDSTAYKHQPDKAKSKEGSR